MYAQDGTIDLSFGSDGLVTFDIAQYGEYYEDAVTDDEGNIIIAGGAYAGDKLKPMIMRLSREGILDTLFNNDGYKLYSLAGASKDSKFNSVLLQADGKIVVGGYAGYTDGTYGVLFRINDDGTPDDAFGENGVVKLFRSDNSYDTFIQKILLQPDGKILYCGAEKSENTGHVSQFITGRCLANGAPDSTFGGVGKVYCYFEGISSYATSLLLQSDGKIIAGGRTNGLFALIRYLANGVPDNTFGEWGEVTTSMTNYAYLTDMGMLSDGKIVAAGYIEMDNPGGCEYGKTRIAVACYNVDGTLNTSFHQDGKELFTYDNCNDESYTLLVQPDDKIIIAGASGNSSILESFNYIFIRVLPDGSKDPAFGDNGTLETDMYEQYEFYSYPRSLIFQPSGKAVLIGYTNDWDVGNLFFSGMRINTGVNPDDLDQMNWNNPNTTDSIMSIWYNDNLLYINNAESEEIDISIYAISGALISAFKAPSGFSQYKIQYLPKGMYFVVSGAGKTFQSQKFIVSYAGY